MVAEQRALVEQLGCARGARGRHRGDPHVRERDRVHRGAARARRRRGRRPRRPGGGAARVPGRDAHARRAARGQRRGGRRRRRLDRARDRHARGRRDVVGVLPRRLRAADRRATGAPTRRRRPSCTRCASTPTACSRGSRCPRSTPPSRSAAAPRRCAGWSAACSTPSRCRARCACSPPSRRTPSRSDSRSTGNGCFCMPAGLTVLDAAASALGRPLRIGRGGLREGVILELAGGRIDRCERRRGTKGRGARPRRP